MILHFLRHAKTNQLSPSGRDFDRELLPRGYEQLSEFRAFVGKNNQQKALSIDHIYCSSAKRTRQTFNEIAGLFPNATISFHDELYLASASELLTFLSSKNSPQTQLSQVAKMMPQNLPDRCLHAASAKPHASGSRTSRGM